MHLVVITFSNTTLEKLRYILLLILVLLTGRVICQYSAVLLASQFESHIAIQWYTNYCNYCVLNPEVGSSSGVLYDMVKVVFFRHKFELSKL